VASRIAILRPPRLVSPTDRRYRRILVKVDP
jgi:hypothetical protein